MREVEPGSSSAGKGPAQSLYNGVRQSVNILFLLCLAEFDRISGLSLARFLRLTLSPRSSNMAVTARADAGVAKLVYAPDSKSGEVTLMRVRVSPPAPNWILKILKKRPAKLAGLFVC